jgi:hypothetical protein
MPSTKSPLATTPKAVEAPVAEETPQQTFIHNFKTTNIKGKEYVEVNQRILYFRNNPAYSGWSLESEVVHLDDQSCVIRAIAKDKEGRVIATGFAQEDRTSSNINKTSYVENCETSAWGRCLANIGIGIETSIASANEVSMAIAKQEKQSNVQGVTAPDPTYQKAFEFLKANPTKENLDKILSKYEFNRIQLINLNGLVK